MYHIIRGKLHRRAAKLPRTALVLRRSRSVLNRARPCEVKNGAPVSKQIKKISHLLASKQEVRETQKDILKLLKLKETGCCSNHACTTDVTWYNMARKLLWKGLLA